MVNEAQLREQIANVVGGNAALGDLYRWLMARNWNVLRNSSPQAAAIAVDVEDVSIEWSDRVRSDSDAVRSLAGLLNTHVVQVAVLRQVDAPQIVLHGNNATSLLEVLLAKRPGIALPSPFGLKQPGVSFGAASSHGAAPVCLQPATV